MASPFYWVFPKTDISTLFLRDCYVGHGREMPDAEDLPRVQFTNLEGHPESLKLFPVQENMALYIDRSSRSGSGLWSIRLFIQTIGPIREVKTFRPESAPVKGARIFAKKAQAAKRRA